LHFAGSTDAPDNLSDILARRPSLGSGRRPDALIELTQRMSMFVRTNGGQKPALDVTRVENVDPPLWRVDLPISHHQGVSAPPVRTAVREKPEVLLREIDPSVGASSFRPEWADVMYAPRPAPQREFRSLRRLNGRPLEPLVVWGTDDRVVFQDASWPWGLVGKVFTSLGKTGSGVLVGDRLVVTAGHMVPWGLPPGEWWMRFVPAYYDGVSLHGSAVEAYVTDAKGWDSGGEVAGYDWALLRLAQPLGQFLGYFGYNGYSTDWNDEPYWSIVGYPGAVANAQRPSLQTGITIFDVDSDSHGGKELESQTADIGPGNSGGPMFSWWSGDPRVVGVVSGEETDYIFPFGSELGNVMAGGSGFTNLIKWGRSNWTFFDQI
jgi:V8-like Glu-specific endopeptidase